MNILFLGLGIDPSSGGIERYSYTNLKYLGQNGHKVFYYTLSPLPQNRPGAPFPPGTEIHSLNKDLPRWKFLDRFLRPYRIAQFFKKTRKIRKMEIDLILCGHLHLSPLAEKLARILNSKFDLFVYGIDCWAGRFAKFFPPGEMNSHLRYVVSISSFTTEQVVAQGWPKERVLYIPPVVEVHNDPHHQLHHGNQPKFILLTVGRLSKAEQYKGHDLVIESLPLISQKIPHVEYWVVGKGDDLPRLQNLAIHYKVAEKVRFFGFVPEENLPSLYQQAHVFILPAKVSLNPHNPQGEGFGIVFLEAALHQKPLIGPNQGGSTDIICHGENGFMIDPGKGEESVEELAGRVVELERDPELRNRLGKNALMTVKNKFSQGRLKDYIQPLLGQGHLR